MRLVYDIGRDGKEDERTLSIELGENGTMIGARVSIFSRYALSDLLHETLTISDDFAAAFGIGDED